MKQIRKQKYSLIVILIVGYMWSEEPPLCKLLINMNEFIIDYNQHINELRKKNTIVSKLY